MNNNYNNDLSARFYGFRGTRRPSTVGFQKYNIVLLPRNVRDFLKRYARISCTKALLHHPLASVTN